MLVLASSEAGVDNWLALLLHPAAWLLCVQKQDKAMLELAKQLKDANSLMFFARGNNYATALEAALKVRAGRLVCVCGSAAGRLPAFPPASAHRGVCVCCAKRPKTRKAQPAALMGHG